jgi:hypothetical protein
MIRIRIALQHVFLLSPSDENFLKKVMKIKGMEQKEQHQLEDLSYFMTPRRNKRKPACFSFSFPSMDGVCCVYLFRNSPSLLLSINQPLSDAEEPLSCVTKASDRRIREIEKSRNLDVCKQLEKTFVSRVVVFLLIFDYRKLDTMNIQVLSRVKKQERISMLQAPRRKRHVRNS